MIPQGMGELPKITIRYNGLFDFDGLYAAIIDWGKNYGYLWHESEYKHKVPSPKGAEQEMKWEMTLNVTEFLRHEIVFTVHLWDFSEVEVNLGEKKKKILSNARISIVITGKLIFDWQKKFGTGKIAQKLGDWYFRAVFKSRLGPVWDQLYYRVWNLHAIIKKYFDMQSKKYAYKGYLGES